MRIALEDFGGGFHIGGRTVTDLRYIDDTALYATDPQTIQDLIDRVNEVGVRYSLILNVKRPRS